jgi:hypothetical protein
MQRGENSTSLRRPARKNKMPLAMLARTLLNKKDGWGEAIGHD